jgi:hypothetical protein
MSWLDPPRWKNDPTGMDLFIIRMCILEHQMGPMFNSPWGILGSENGWVFFRTSFFPEKRLWFCLCEAKKTFEQR